MKFRLVPIEPALTDYVRRELRAPQYGHPAFVEPAKGYGPCRSCLRTFESTEEQRILFTYSPVPEGGGTPQPGPVFIHANACEPHTGECFPEPLKNVPMLLELISDNGRRVERVAIERGDDPERTIARVLQDHAADTIHLRNAEAGCFVARVERAR